MSSIRPSPARIVKRADVSAGLASLLAPDVATSAPVPSTAADRLPPPPARRLAKEARLVPGAPGSAVVEVRCSCGESTHVELRWSENRNAEEPR